VRLTLAPASPPAKSKRDGAEERKRSGFDGYDFKAQEEMHKVLDENSDLKRELDQRRAEVQRLQEALVTLQDELKAHEAVNDTPQAAVRDLARKNRDLNLSLERERTRVARLLNEVEHLRTELAAQQQVAKHQARAKHGASAGAAVATASPPSGEAAEKEAGNAEAERWKDLYHKANQKLVEARSEAQKLRQETLLMQRALQKEIGEEVPLERVLDATGNWRGRAQEIALLRAKLRDLSKRLDAANAASGSQSISASSPRAGSAGIGLGNGSLTRDFQERHEAELAKMRAARQEEIARLEIDKTTAEQQLATIQEKYKALRTRHRIVEEGARDLRQKLQVLLDKSANDDKLVDSLRAELEAERRKVKANGSAPVSRAGAVSAASGRGAAASNAAEVPGAVGTSEEANALRMQVQSQHKIIAALRERLEQAESAQMQAFKALSSEWDRREKDSKIQLLHSESEKRREVAELLSARLSTAEQQLIKLAAELEEARSARDALEEQVQHARGAAQGAAPSLGKKRSSDGRASATSRASAQGAASKPADNGAEAAAVAAARRERDAVLAQYQAALTGKQQEVELLQTMIAQQRALHQKAVNTLRQQFFQIQAQLEEQTKAAADAHKAALTAAAVPPARWKSDSGSAPK
jgi:DNA repair exonuclease SbcCD ATPase subunit